VTDKDMTMMDDMPVNNWRKQTCLL
jgi:hypothetical protein